MKCPKCNGQMTEGSFEILNFIQADFGHNLLIGPHKTFYLNPRRRSQINVYVCKECGYIESYADDPSGL
ncbi:MAG: PF20097 family protein [Actinomycetota bacterium]